MRTSTDQLKNGIVWNGFDYTLQVWVLEGIIQNCGHPQNMSKGHGCCNARTLHGRKISETQGHEVRSWNCTDDVCQVQGCDQEVIFEDYGYTLCHQHSQLPEYARSIADLARKESSQIGEI